MNQTKTGLQVTEKTPIKAMILAAGRGKRLRPLTDSLPKPLVGVLGKPLIEYHLEKLAKAGVKEVVINHAWLGEKIESTLGNGERWGIKIHYSAEPEGGLETAGGIINALPMLGSQPFLVVNGDVFTEMDFLPLVKKAEDLAEQQSRDNENTFSQLGHVVLVPSPEHNPQGDFGINDNGMVEPQGHYTFAGVSVLSANLFAGLEVGFIALAPILREAMQNSQISGQIEYGLWSDVGTLERLQQTEQWLQAGHSERIGE